MKDASQNDRPSGLYRIPPAVLIGALFLVLRLPLLVVRAPFFDELFTHWIAGKTFAGILSALRYDSGPPLYYFLVHMLGDPPVAVTRVLSLLFAAISLSLILRSMRLSPAPRTAVANSFDQVPALAGALLAVFPPAVLFAVDARAYALCAMFVTIAVLAIDDGRPFVAALALVLAAYAHYYGALCFPMLLAVAAGPAAVQPAGRRRYGILPFSELRSLLRDFVRGVSFGRRLAALALAAFLFFPGALLAMRQPAAAREWMTFAWPDALFVRAPLILAVVGGIALLLSLRLNRYLFMTLVPLILALALGVYVPMRFEAVIAAPLVLALGESLRRNRLRLALMAVMLAVGVSWSILAVLDHLHRPVDPYREAASWVAHRIRADENVVASGYCYLETRMSGHVRVTAFPPEQAEHPGWRATPAPGLPAPRGSFFWIGERGAPELSIFTSERRRIEPLFINDRAMVALVR